MASPNLTLLLSKCCITSYSSSHDHLLSNYCWMHGTAYVRSHLQGIATGCYVDQARLDSAEDAPITAYYLWLPYLLSLLYVLAKLPHSLWKKFFENNLINSIIGLYFLGSCIYFR